MLNILKGNLNRNAVWVLPLAIFFGLLFFNLGQVTGIQRDEAVSGLVAWNILSGGELPTTGAFNDYTAPIHYYLVALAISVFGKSVWSLRLVGVVFNILAALALFDTMRRYSPRASLYSLWFLVTFPVIVISARVAVEINALGPLFLFGGIWCVAVLGSSGSTIKSFFGYFLAGLSFGLGVWNHVILLPVVIGVILVFLGWKRPSYHDLRELLPAFLLGGTISVMPRLYLILFQGSPWIPDTPPIAHAPLAASFLNIIYTVGGDALYARCCGKTIASLNWFLPLGFLASSSILFLTSVSNRYRQIWLLAATCVILGLIGIWLAVPENRLGSRIWLMPLWFAPILLGSAVAAITKNRTRILVAALIVTTSLLSLCINYFYSFSKTGGTPSGSVYVGGRYDESLDALRKQPTIESIVRYSDSPFYFQDAEPWTAMFLVPASQMARVRNFGELNSDDRHVEKGSLVALCRVPALQQSQVIYYAGLKLELRPLLSNSTYLVYEYSGEKLKQ